MKTREELITCLKCDALYYRGDNLTDDLIHYLQPPFPDPDGERLRALEVALKLRPGFGWLCDEGGLTYYPIERRQGFSTISGAIDDFLKRQKPKPLTFGDLAVGEEHRPKHVRFQERIKIPKYRGWNFVTSTGYLGECPEQTEVDRID